jgi:hypothetical protein
MRTADGRDMISSKRSNSTRGATCVGKGERDDHDDFFHFFHVSREHRPVIRCLMTVNLRPRRVVIPLRRGGSVLGEVGRELWGRDYSTGCVARSHRGLGSHCGTHDSVIDRGT